MGNAEPGSLLLEASAVLEEQGSGLDGLSEEEAEARLTGIGPNRLPEPRSRGTFAHLLGQLLHFFALMLWAAALLAFIGRMPQLGVAIVVVVVVNGAFSFAQEYRAERATQALSALIPVGATVVRSGRKHRVPVEDLVPGDVVLLREGDRISADARVIRSDGLRVDNSTLTGESEPLERTAEPMDSPPDDPADAVNLVFAGTYTAGGSALARSDRSGTEAARRPIAAGAGARRGDDRRRGQRCSGSAPRGHRGRDRHRRNRRGPFGGRSRASRRQLRPHRRGGGGRSRRLRQHQAIPDLSPDRQRGGAGAVRRVGPFRRIVSRWRSRCSRCWRWTSAPTFYRLSRLGGRNRSRGR